MLAIVADKEKRVVTVPPTASVATVTVPISDSAEGFSGLQAALAMIRESSARLEAMRADVKATFGGQQQP